MNWQWARLGYGCSLGSSLFCPPTPGKCPSDLALSAGLIENKPSGATRTALLPARGIAGACVKWSVPTSLCRKATVPPPLGPDQCAGAGTARTGDVTSRGTPPREASRTDSVAMEPRAGEGRPRAPPEKRAGDAQGPHESRAGDAEGYLRDGPGKAEGPPECRAGDAEGPPERRTGGRGRAT